MIHKALSVRAPWWWYILHAGKDIENRNWPTRVRGTVYIHASKHFVLPDVVDDLDQMERRIPELATRRQAMRYSHETLLARRQFIVGQVDIVDCVAHSNSPWFFGDYGFVLANPIAYARPVKCVGALGFFAVPDDVLAQLADAKPLVTT